MAIGQARLRQRPHAGTKAETPDSRLIDCDKLAFQTTEPDISSAATAPPDPYTIDAITTGRGGAAHPPTSTSTSP
ncbi:MAG: hypothetical protein ACLUEK_05220 [Oscillospiraceae bacterium]